LKQVAEARGLKFVLIGGHAVNYHGYARTTADLDLLVCRDDREAWLAGTAEVGYRLFREGATFLQMESAESSVWPLDLMLAAPETFRALLAAAQPIQLEGEEVPVVSLRHLLALKLHALKHTHVGRVLKDFEDVLSLLQVNRLDPGSDEIRDLCLKYADAEIHGRLLRASRG
jgi:predicted nucleotidyltransferase